MVYQLTENTCGVSTHYNNGRLDSVSTAHKALYATEYLILNEKGCQSRKGDYRVRSKQKFYDYTEKSRM